MGTTIVALSFGDAFATMAHVGDSRIFRISENRILQLTQDHSWLNELIEDNEINEEQIETFVEKNVITRALGTGPTIKIDCHCEKYKKGDIYVLCTDGVHNSVRPESIKKLLNKTSATVDSRAKRLVDRALRIDGSDNLTVALAQVAEDSQDTRHHGIATTVQEENKEILTAAEKLIQAEYTEPQLQNFRKPAETKMSQRKLFFTGLLALTGLLCFVMGMVVQTKSGPANGLRDRPALQSNVAAASAIGNSAIQRSALAKDAVLAYVFFNSRLDFDRAMLSERATVIETFDPYKEIGGIENDKKFSIFLIDAQNNVISKTSEVRLPVFGEN